MKKCFRKFLNALLHILAFLLFLAVLALSFYGINRILMPKNTQKNSLWPTTSNCNQFYGMEKDSVDVLFLGSSVVVNAFSPQQLYNDYGIRSYNLGTEQQSLFVSYYWLREALRFQSPQAVVVDLKFAYPYNDTYGKLNMTEGLLRKSMDWMRYSPVKREAIREIHELDPQQSEISYLFPNIRFRSRWTEVTEEDFDFKNILHSDLKGFSPLSEPGPEDYFPDTLSDPEAREPMAPVMEDYLTRIAELCREHEIQLILTNIPGSSHGDGVHNTIAEFAEKQNAQFVNFCEESVFSQLGADFPVISVFNHANILGAERLTDYMGKALTELGIQGQEDLQYEKTKEIYQIKRDEKANELVTPFLKEETDFAAYLQLLQGNGYSVFITVGGDGMGNLGEKEQEALKKLGFRTDFSDLSGSSFCGAVTPEGITEKKDPQENIRLSGEIPSQKLTFQLFSAGNEKGKSGYVILSGQQYAMNSQGITVAVYDNLQHTMADVAFFEADPQGSPVREFKEAESSQKAA